MAYKKFDDPVNTNINAGQKKLFPEFKDDRLRRALAGLFNRVLSGSAGTGGTSISNINSNLGTGATCGVKLTGDWLVLINGRVGTVAGQDNIYMPAGTQASASYVKYLVAAKFGTNATIYAGNEGTASTTAYLPDLPDGYVALGWVEYAANATAAFGRVGGGTAKSQNILSGKTAGTDGTINAWVSLIHMPYDETGL